MKKLILIAALFGVLSCEQAKNVKPVEFSNNSTQIVDTTIVDSTLIDTISIN